MTDDESQTELFDIPEERDEAEETGWGRRFHDSILSIFLR